MDVEAVIANYLRGDKLMDRNLWERTVDDSAVEWSFVVWKDVLFVLREVVV